MSDSLESGVPSDADPIDAAWDALQEAWDEPGAHKRFLAVCVGHDRLKDAGMRYRSVIDGDDPKRRAVAERQIDRILASAMSNLEAHRTPPPRRNTKLLLVALVVFVLLVGGATWAVLGVP